MPESGIALEILKVEKRVEIVNTEVVTSTRGVGRCTEEIISR